MSKISEVFAKLQHEAAKLNTKNPMPGLAQGGYVGSGEPIKGRLFLHDHDGHTCEIVADVHYPVISADEVRKLAPKLLEAINDRR